jgi:hypothetical protein
MRTMLSARENGQGPEQGRSFARIFRDFWGTLWQTTNRGNCPVLWLEVCFTKELYVETGGDCGTGDAGSGRVAADGVRVSGLSR